MEGGRRIRLGVDVGGTFTDVVAIEEGQEGWSVLKVPSTPDSPDLAVLTAVEEMIKQRRTTDVSFFGHGTTAGTNAFLTKRGASTALVTTAGFEDVLEFRRMDRSGVLDPYDLQLKFPAPLVPRRRRFGLRERIGRGGEVVTPLSADEVDRVVGLLADCGAQAVAISLLWSFENPTHESMLREAVEKALPDVFVSCSHEIDPTMMEYERTSTTVVNAYLGPLINTYFRKVDEGTHRLHLRQPLIMQSNGGLASIREAGKRPVALLESGPAAGVAACSYLSGLMNVSDLLAVDMGGTSFDVALIVNGRPRQHIESEVHGYAVRAPMLDIRSIGAGGGSIAWLDDANTLRVGPQSAGSQPGPVCYGRGGTKPTVSDANVVLGYLQDLTGGSFTLDIEAARLALLDEIGRPLSLDATGAAHGVYRLVNAHMADAMRIMMSEAALNPADLTLMVYGGAGPVHGSALAREMDIPRTVVPLHPGALSALGAATGDIVHDFVEPVMKPLDILEAGELGGLFEAMEATGCRVLLEEGVTSSAQVFQRYFVARYIGQSHDLQVILEDGDSMNASGDKLAALFHNLHRDTYGISVETEPVLVVSVRLRAVGVVAKPRFAEAASDIPPVIDRMARAWFESTAEIEVPVYTRRRWRTDVKIDGPAIIQEYDSTTVVLPGQRWHQDEWASIVIEEA
jgi:N-methylhydantoinase A